MIYRVRLWDGRDNSFGYSYHSTVAAAYKALREWKAGDPEMRERADVTAVRTPKNKAEIVALLGRRGGHADNG